MSVLYWHYGPTDRYPEPDRMWHTGCGKEVLYLDGGFICECGATDSEPPPSLVIRFKRLVPHAHMPTYAHINDAGMDLYAAADKTLWAYHKAIISTGIALEIPEGYFGMVRPRSGLAVTKGITATSSGVIDSGYRGEIKVLLHNLGMQRYDISIGDRIAQLLILPVLHAVLEEASELSQSTRGTGSHGSTGK